MHKMIPYEYRWISDLVGMGLTLVVGQDKGWLANSPNGNFQVQGLLGNIVIHLDVVKDILNTGMFGELTPTRNNHKLGWTELGFTDAAVKYYKFIQ